MEACAEVGPFVGEPREQWARGPGVQDLFPFRRAFVALLLLQWLKPIVV
jgi:hypothetical protein